MTDRERLIELLGLYLPINVPNQMGSYDTIGERTLYYDDRERLADHLIANGVIVPPCKVGDTLYAVRYWSTRKQIYSFVAPDIAWIIEHINDFDKTIFLTREEAEKALKERVK